MLVIFDTSDIYVNRLSMAESNLFSLVIQLIKQGKNFAVMLFFNPIYAENDAKLFLVIGPFLGSHYRFQSRLSLTLPGVLKNLSTFFTFCL